MKGTDWPPPPIQPEDLGKIRELLTAEEYEMLLKRLAEYRLEELTGEGADLIAN